MNMLDLMNKMTQLSEAKEKTKTGLKHTAEPGGYGRKDDEDDEGHKVKATAVKKGKGRPKKDADDSGETKKYDFSAFGVKSGKDVKLPKHDKKKTTVVKGKSQSHAANKVDDGTDPGEESKTKAKKKGLKEYFDLLDKAIMNEDGITVKPMPGASQIIGPDGKPMGTADATTANMMKQASEKGMLKIGGETQVKEEDIGKHNNATTGFDALVRKLTPKYGAEAAKRIAGAQLKKIKEADQPPNDSLMSPMSEAKADKKKCPPMSHIKKMCQDGKSVAEICKMHPDCDQKELKQMVADCKKTLDEDSMPMKKVNGKSVPAFAADGKGKNDLTKKKVKEGMEHKLKAARHTGKAHALSKQGYNCGYDDMEEARHYHEGFKEGLDECYGQMPIQGYVGEANNEVADMASYGAHTPTMEDELDEMDKTSYMKQQAIKTPGDTFKAFGQTFKDKEVLESPFAFEAWEKELNSILEGKDVTEGMTVSISKGQQGSPDSVSVSAQDAEADQLLGIIKSAGLGLFGGDDAGHPQATPPMTVDVDGGEGPQAEIEVVDDHDDMLSLIRKMTGQGPAQANGDYEEEGGHEEGSEPAHSHEETCNECGGMMEEGHACGEAIEEDEIDDGEENETMDQREYNVAEGEEVVNNNDEAEEEQTDATRDAALATAAGKNFADTDAPLEEGGDGGEASDTGADGVDIADVADETEEDLDESLANGNDDTFESDIDFMTNVISGGLNKRKPTGQTTIPVVSTQVNRLGNPMKESTDLLTDWRKLSGIK